MHEMTKLGAACSKLSACLILLFDIRWGCSHLDTNLGQACGKMHAQGAPHCKSLLQTFLVIWGPSA